MELSQLEVFLAVAREHRFSRAADKLFRTQSAVSQTIRKLEVDRRRPSKQIADLLADCLHIPADERATFLSFARSGDSPAPPAGGEAAGPAERRAPAPSGSECVAPPEPSGTGGATCCMGGATGAS